MHVAIGLLTKHSGKVKKPTFFFCNVCSHALMGDCHQYTPNLPRLLIQRFHRRIATGKKITFERTVSRPVVLT